jgi:hypothetical protein
LKKEIQRKDVLIEKARIKTKTWNTTFQKHLNTVWNHNQTIAETNKKQTTENLTVRDFGQDQSQQIPTGSEKQNEINLQESMKQEELLNSDQELEEELQMPVYSDTFSLDANNTTNINNNNNNQTSNNVDVDLTDDITVLEDSKI